MAYTLDIVDEGLLDTNFQNSWPLYIFFIQRKHWV